VVLRKGVFPTTRPRSRLVDYQRRQLAFCALALCVVVGGVALDVAPAGAAGNGPLAKEILTNPLPGWVAVPQADMAPTVSDLQGVESAAAKITGMSALVAGNGWYSPHGQLLEILLVAFVGKPVNALITRSLQAGTKVAVENLCEGATTEPPTTLSAMTSPPGYLSVCHAESGKDLKGFAFEKGDELGLLVSTFSSSQLVAVSLRQYEAVPPNGFEPSPSSSAGRIGSTEVFSTTGQDFSVQLAAVTTPASPATPTVTPPKTGDRYVALRFTIHDIGTASITGDADSSASVIGSNEQIYTSVPTIVTGCTNFDYGSFQLSHGQSVSGCVVFDIPDAVRVATVKWSLGIGGKGAEWSV
jgi:hypothetical protein